MVSIPGASAFRATVSYNVTQGVDPLDLASSPSLLGGFDNNVSLLEIGKQLQANGIGLSARARAITSDFLAQSQNGVNIILSAGAQNTIDGANTQIKALQSKLPKSSIGSFSARYDREGNAGDSNPYNTLGQTVNKSA